MMDLGSVFGGLYKLQIQVIDYDDWQPMIHGSCYGRWQEFQMQTKMMTLVRNDDGSMEIQVG